MTLTPYFEAQIAWDQPPLYCLASWNLWIERAAGF